MYATKFNYDAFGNVKTLVPDGLGNYVAAKNTSGPRFGGQFYDASTDQVYLRNRYYSPGTGRFNTMDPIGSSGGHNLYGYCGGDPVNRADPMGLDYIWTKGIDFSWSGKELKAHWEHIAGTVHLETPTRSGRYLGDIWDTNDDFLASIPFVANVLSKTPGLNTANLPAFIAAKFKRAGIDPALYFPVGQAAAPTTQIQYSDPIQGGLLGTIAWTYKNYNNTKPYPGGGFGAVSGAGRAFSSTMPLNRAGARVSATAQHEMQDRILWPSRNQSQNTTSAPAGNNQAGQTGNSQETGPAKPGTPGRGASGLPGDGSGGTNEETTSLYKAPQPGRGESQYLEGYKPEDFSEGERRAFFTRNPELARDYARHYGEGVTEVKFNSEDYQRNFSQYERPYQGGPEIEVPIPSHELDKFNDLTLERIWHEGWGK